MIKNLPTMQDTWVWSLGQEDSLEKRMSTHSNILAWRIPWREEPGWLQSKSQIGLNNSHFHFQIYSSLPNRFSLRWYLGCETTFHTFFLFSCWLEIFYTEAKKKKSQLIQFCISRMMFLQKGKNLACSNITQVVHAFKKLTSFLFIKIKH